MDVVTSGKKRRACNHPNSVIQNVWHQSTELQVDSEPRISRAHVAVFVDNGCWHISTKDLGLAAFDTLSRHFLYIDCEMSRSWTLKL